MELATEPLVVGVRFSKVGKIYHFVADNVTDIKVGDMVVVETSRGWQLGQVAQVVPDPEPPPEGWKAIDRRATPRDLLLRQMWQMKEAEVVSNCRSKSVELNLVGIKIVSAEYSFDGSRLTILFSSETEEKYDLKSLRQDMQKMLAPSQVEMRQIGPRDVAKTVCGMGACGLETRCCCMFLTEFSSISIRMAKEQGISLTPTEITGMCGRLRCCLIYEYDTYVEARQKLPKRNKRVRTPQGDGKVVDVIPLRGAVMVDLPEVGWREFPGSEVQVLDGTEGPMPPAAAVPPPFQGTQQASEIDQAITGDETVKPFVVSPQSPQPEPPSENPPAGEGPGSRPRTGGPRGGGGRPDRPAQPRPGGQGRTGGRDQSSGRDQASGREPTRGNEPASGSEPSVEKSQHEQRRNRGQRPGGGRGPGQRREGQPRGGAPRGGTPSGGTPTGGTPTGSIPSGAQPKPGEQNPDAPKQTNPGGGAQPARSRQDQRRRRGRRRDNNEPENRS